MIFLGFIYYNFIYLAIAYKPTEGGYSWLLLGCFCNHKIALQEC